MAVVVEFLYDALFNGLCENRVVFLFSDGSVW